MLRMTPQSIEALPVMVGNRDDFSKKDVSSFDEKQKSDSIIKSSNSNSNSNKKKKNGNKNNNENNENAPKRKPSSTNQRTKRPSSTTVPSSGKNGSSQARMTDVKTSSSAVASTKTQRNRRRKEKKPIGVQTHGKSNRKRSSGSKLMDILNEGKEGFAHLSAHSRVSLERRPSVDVARDTLRILEIVYGKSNDSSAKTLSTEEEPDDNSIEKDEKKRKKRKKDEKKSKEKKKTSSEEEKLEAGEDQQVTTTNHVDGKTNDSSAKTSPTDEDTEGNSTEKDENKRKEDEKNSNEKKETPSEEEKLEAGEDQQVTTTNHVHGKTNKLSAKTLATDEEPDDKTIENYEKKRKEDDTKSNEKKETPSEEEKLEAGEDQQVTTTNHQQDQISMALHDTSEEIEVPLKVGDLISRFEADSKKNEVKAIPTPTPTPMTKEADLVVLARSASTSSGNGKKRRKRRSIVQRDAAGKIIRRRKMGNGRDKVVRKDCFKKGKDAKIGLPTIDEAFYDNLSVDDSSCDEWFTDECGGDDRPNSGENSDLDSDDDGSNLNGSNRRVEGTEPKARKNAKAKKKGKRPVNRHAKIQQSNNGAIEVSLTNGASSSEYQLTGSATTSLEGTLNSSGRSTSDNQDVENQNGSEDIVHTLRDPDNNNINGRGRPSLESNSSAESTACTSTAEPENERGEKWAFFCGSFRAMICAGFWFFFLVAAVTVTVLYFVFYRDRFEEQKIGTSPSLPSLPPSLSPFNSPDLTQAPTTIFDSLSTSCYLPDEKQGSMIAEAEFATEKFGLASISNVNTGYCGEGYVTSLTRSGSGFGIGSFEVTTTGFYKVFIRYSYPGKTYQSLRLQINGQYKGTFELVSTGDETLWLVDGIGDIALREGEQTISMWVNFHGEIGPNIDWLTLTLQEPITRYEYLTSLIEQSSDVVAQPTFTRTLSLEWMSFEDPIDWSILTDREVIERYALVQIFHATKGETWTNSNRWLSKSHACSWYGVTCSTDRLVTDLILDENGLAGDLPAELSLLENLILISLQDNELQGFIPKEIGKLTNLSKILLHANFLTGTLPSEMGWLEDLKDFDIGANFCFGTIPEEFFSMVRLETLVLRSNYLTGTLSTSVGQLKVLKKLDVRNGDLEGTIPSELGELTLLTNLILGYNSFTGTIPRELGLLQNLSILDVNSNKLTGLLPPELSLLENTVIDYYGNNIVV